MNAPRFDDLQVGDVLPGLETGPITRQVLGAYAAASGDHNPLHLNPDYARRSGMPDAFAHGMLSAAYLARVVTQWVEPAALRSLSVRFVAITWVGDTVHCHARVAEKFIAHGARCVRLALTACSPQGDVRLTASAVVALDRSPGHGVGACSLEEP